MNGNLDLVGNWTGKALCYSFDKNFYEEQISIAIEKQKENVFHGKFYVKDSGENPREVAFTGAILSNLSIHIQTIYKDVQCYGIVNSHDKIELTQMYGPSWSCQLKQCHAVLTKG